MAGVLVELERVTRVGLVDLGLILGSDVIYSIINIYPAGYCYQLEVLTIAYVIQTHG